MLTLTQYEANALIWAHERGILNNSSSITQLAKLTEETGELASNILRGKSAKDDIGDILVVLSIMARLEGTTLTECFDHAWEEIKDRKGYLTPEGNFVKAEPLPGISE